MTVVPCGGYPMRDNEKVQNTRSGAHNSTCCFTEASLKASHRGACAQSHVTVAATWCYNYDLKESNHPPREEPALVMNGETSVKSGACSGLSLASMALCTKSGHQNDKGVNSICYCTILQHLETSP
ncbi:hypothetical protein V5799_025319 [Amblyomma americanum]|uniref:Uncharacterized protein n=1 Tax=Amblyomma americanum TaxID=6943 RepID=A0AAQ4E9J9_AMBAM